ncbi:protein of unknown function [Petrocella atlantisensis]|uniref:Uncharacterized protein n=1 Tax=Petrocella atlantisensis TaxID=2173034 RepID=A0A3P7NUJ0_9FIRM|nr:protein of unknown function [Petrocella atlantisensis]
MCNTGYEVGVFFILWKALLRPYVGRKGKVYLVEYKKYCYIKCICY